MRNFPLTELREKLFGNTFERSKSGSTYKKILGFKVRLSDHYVSKVGGGSTNRGDIEIVLNSDDTFGISLNNGEVWDLLYDWLEKESNDTQELDESGVLKMFDYLKSKTRIKKAKGHMFRNLDKIKNNLGADLYNHIGSLNKTQLQKQLKELRSELGRISNKKDSRYYNLKDEEFFILYRLEKADEFQYAKGGKMAEGGVLESEINELYKKSNFINDDFNWKLKLLEMIQDMSIEAYNIYQTLTKKQKEEVLQEQFEVDNDMGSDGDGTIKTTKENIRILLNDAKNGNKYAKGGNMAEGGLLGGFNYSIGGL